ncbi:aromatic motif membrane protein [Mycoplasmopsis pulmonis]|nr:aromatic motif membrane protein [Mycoplasmopsis pulmonis]MDZ7293160.1 hypothetical protein [Mycoplasmopsis pulmonis]VEU67957.1 Uncharacterised protein [Mycoplasmopsis pulmonis]
MKFKKTFFLIFTSIFSLAIVSCSVDYSNFNKYIDVNKNVVESLKNPQQIKTNQILDVILNHYFEKDEVAKVNFQKQQDETEYQQKILKQIEEISNKIVDEKSKEFIDQLNKIFSQNWYLILKNLDKFHADFFSWYTIDVENTTSGETAKSSMEYLDNLKTLKKYNNLKFNDAYLDQIKEGETSGLSDSFADYYIKKDKLLFNLKITKEDNESKISFSPFVYNFAKTKNDISINLISNIFHNALIHHNQKYVDIFEKEIIKKHAYGEPALMLMKIRTKNE